MGFYEVLLSNGHQHEVELVPSGHTWKAEVDGHEMTIRLLGACHDDGLLVEIDGERVCLPWNPEDQASFHQAIEHVSVSVPILPQRKAPSTPSIETNFPVSSPISGVVVQVQVEVGQDVEVGQPLLIMEAMKMENIIRAPRNGVIQSIAFQPGHTIRKGQNLITLTPHQHD